MSTIPEKMKVKILDYFFEKPLAITISMVLNVVLIIGIQVLWGYINKLNEKQDLMAQKQDRLEDKIFDLQHEVNTKIMGELHEFNENARDLFFYYKQTPSRAERKDTDKNPQ